jgi:sporulation protein YqfC
MGMEHITDFLRYDGLVAETLGMPIVTISGRGEVRIENHLGISEYESGAITVRGGAPTASRRFDIRITGSELEIRSMSSDVLVISGVIHAVTL